MKSRPMPVSIMRCLEMSENAGRTYHTDSTSISARLRVNIWKPLVQQAHLEDAHARGDHDDGVAGAVEVAVELFAFGARHVDVGLQLGLTRLGLPLHVVEVVVELAVFRLEIADALVALEHVLLAPNALLVVLFGLVAELIGGLGEEAFETDANVAGTAQVLVTLRNGFAQCCDAALEVVRVGSGGLARLVEFGGGGLEALGGLHELGGGVRELAFDAMVFLAELERVLLGLAQLLAEFGRARFAGLKLA